MKAIDLLRAMDREKFMPDEEVLFEDSAGGLYEVRHVRRVEREDTDGHYIILGDSPGYD